MVAPRLYNPLNDHLQKNLLLKWRLARQRTDRNARIMVVGDSWSRGQSTGGGTAQSANSYPSQLARKLQARGINAGAANLFCDGGGFGGAQTIANAEAGNAALTHTGAWTLGVTKSVGGNAFTCAAAGVLSWTPPFSVKRFVNYWRDGALGRNMHCDIDGGASTGMNSTGASVIGVTPIDAAAAGTHTLNVTWDLGSVTWIGAEAFDNTGGRTEISVWNHSICGAQASAFLDNTDTYAGRLAFWNAFPPDLTIICPIINNWRSSISLAQTQTDVQALITQGLLTGSVLLITPPFDGGTSGFAAQQDAYSAMLASLGPLNGAAVMDFRSTLGSYAIGNAAGAYSDTVHGNQLIYGDVADQILELII